MSIDQLFIDREHTAPDGLPMCNRCLGTRCAYREDLYDYGPCSTCISYGLIDRLTGKRREEEDT